jgi:radical SAM protein with 4Fe4S-binding SPASM domain
MPLALARKALRQAVAAGTRRVRLTGGEPLLHEACVPLLRAIRAAGLEPWLNTAGLPAGETPWPALGRYAHDVLLPLRESAQRRELRAAVRALRRGGSARVRFGVVLTPDHLEILGDMIAFAAALDAPLEAYRVMTVPGHVRGNTAAELRHAVTLLERANRWRPPAAHVRIANAVPFCVAPDRALVARNSCGARFDDGRSRLVVGPDGEVRPSYVLRLPLGNIARQPLTALWRHPGLLALHAAASLPSGCRGCAELARCRGGSRHEARVASGRLDGPDPLAPGAEQSC